MTSDSNRYFLQVGPAQLDRAAHGGLGRLGVAVRVEQPPVLVPGARVAGRDLGRLAPQRQVRAPHARTPVRGPAQRQRNGDDERDDERARREPQARREPPGQPDEDPRGQRRHGRRGRGEVALGHELAVGDERRGRERRQPPRGSRSRPTGRGATRGPRPPAGRAGPDAAAHVCGSAGERRSHDPVHREPGGPEVQAQVQEQHERLGRVEARRVHHARAEDAAVRVPQGGVDQRQRQQREPQGQVQAHEPLAQRRALPARHARGVGEQDQRRQGDGGLLAQHRQRRERGRGGGERHAAAGRVHPWMAPTAASSRGERERGREQAGPALDVEHRGAAAPGAAPAPSPRPRRRAGVARRLPASAGQQAAHEREEEQHARQVQHQVDDVVPARSRPEGGDVEREAQVRDRARLLRAGVDPARRPHVQQRGVVADVALVVEHVG